jgi:hypothetical protein
MMGSPDSLARPTQPPASVRKKILSILLRPQRQTLRPLRSAHSLCQSILHSGSSTRNEDYEDHERDKVGERFEIKRLKFLIGCRRHF